MTQTFLVDLFPYSYVVELVHVLLNFTCTYIETFLLCLYMENISISVNMIGSLIQINVLFRNNKMYIYFVMLV